MSIVSPFSLLQQSGPRSLRIADTSALAQLLAGLSLQIEGQAQLPDHLYFGNLNQPESPLLALFSSKKYLEQVAQLHGGIVLTTPDLASDVPADNLLLLVPDNPKTAYYQLLEEVCRAGLFEQLQGYVSPSAKIHPRAFVDSNVYVDERAYVGPNAVVLANTYVGKDCVIQPNATVGSDGFQAFTANGRNQICTHGGGVWLGDGTQVGANTCVDKGLFGGFTFLGEGTKVDNLVHIAHDVRVGSNCLVIACSEVSGSVRLGDFVYLAPGATLTNGLEIGSRSFIGIGSLVTRSLPPHSFAFGSPARRQGWACDCRAKLSGDGEQLECKLCGSRFGLQGEELTRLPPGQ